MYKDNEDSGMWGISLDPADCAGDVGLNWQYPSVPAPPGHAGDS